ncbi:hypothetical protein BTR22_05970 [Alkalihalophilus pseudofirmus]|uniref:DUF1273 domain-containing protein n=1 Tax=Alkalihalophilus pseudofirmus TaxID=79885 RepID=UPI0009527A96|nr:hypothetical protein BTR22_05970 [Alkalihalophilus pseudofirmus]
MKVLAVSGYKGHELGIFDQKHQGITYIKKALEQKLRSYIDEGLEWVLISGQLGVELWAAEVVLALKSEFSDLKLSVLTPFYNQEERWSEETQNYYKNIVNQADFVDSITKRPYDNPAQLRLKNEFIIEKSDALLLLVDEEKPGSPMYYLEPAKQKALTTHYPIHYITPMDLDFLIQDEQMNNADYW